MLDRDTFLITVYVLADDFCQTLPPPPRHPGPLPSLTPSEVLTLALLGQWQEFPSERAFYRYAQRHLRPYFPTLPARSQFNRLLRQQADTLARFALFLADQATPVAPAYELLDCTAMPTRDPRRRGLGWLPGIADLSWSNRLGWYEGFHLLLVVSPTGVITGFGLGPASVNDRALAETLFARRQHPDPHLPGVGHPTPSQIYVADSGFGGRQREADWQARYGIHLVASPQRDSHRRWPRAVRRWAAGVRQIIETVFDRLLHRFRLDRERPHDLVGGQARLAAKIGLHNLFCWLNPHLGRPPLAVADLIDW